MKHQRHVTLELDIDTAPIAGRLRDEQGACVEFPGWLELASALERLLRLSPGEPPTIPNHG